MPTSLQGRVAVITGSAKRLGAGIAETLARHGCGIVINYRSSAAAAESITRTLVEAGANAICVAADVAQAEDAERLLQQSLDHFGRVDYLVANASTFRRTPVASLTAQDWHEGIAGNLTVAALPALVFGRWMKTHGGGAIVALADSAGERPWRDYLPYSVGKAGVIALTRGLAKELAPEVRVNAIAPGPMLFPDDYDDAARQREIERTLLKRAGEPHHIADAVLFLLTHDYITGALLPVDGGRGLS